MCRLPNFFRSLSTSVSFSVYLLWDVSRPPVTLSIFSTTRGKRTACYGKKKREMMKSLVNTKANKTSHHYHQTVKKENTLKLPCLSLHSAVALWNVGRMSSYLLVDPELFYFFSLPAVPKHFFFAHEQSLSWMRKSLFVGFPHERSPFLLTVFPCFKHSAVWQRQTDC